MRKFVGVEVSAGREPQAELPVPDQQHPGAGWVDDIPGGGEVADLPAVAGRGWRCGGCGGHGRCVARRNACGVGPFSIAARSSRTTTPRAATESGTRCRSAQVSAHGVIAALKLDSDPLVRIPPPSTRIAAATPSSSGHRRLVRTPRPESAARRHASQHLAVPIGRRTGRRKVIGPGRWRTFRGTGLTTVPARVSVIEPLPGTDLRSVLPRGGGGRAVRRLACIRRWCRGDGSSSYGSRTS